MHMAGGAGGRYAWDVWRSNVPSCWKLDAFLMAAMNAVVPASIALAFPGLHASVNSGLQETTGCRLGHAL